MPEPATTTTAIVTLGGAAVASTALTVLANCTTPVQQPSRPAAGSN